jgi:hypothetical protein
MPHNRLPDSEAEPTPFPPLPSEIELLFIGAEEPSWTLLTLQLDRLGCGRPRFRWCSDLSEAARLLRHEGFDCIVIDDVSVSEGGPAPNDDVLAQLQAIRTGGCDDPLLLLTDRVDEGFLSAAAACDCELLITRLGWRSLAVIPWVRRTIERWKAARERDLSRSAEEDRSRRQSDESLGLLARRRELAACVRGTALADAPSGVQSAYAELLRAAIILGGDALRDEQERVLAQMLRSGMSSADALALHVASVESLLQGLAGHTARHVIERADLLALELLARLGDRVRGSSSPFDAGVDLLAEELPR